MERVEFAFQLTRSGGEEEEEEEKSPRVANVSLVKLFLFRWKPFTGQQRKNK